MLLFVFWYCHKRGREVRLEKEGLAAGGTASDADSISSLEASTIIEDPSSTVARDNAEAERLQAVLDKPTVVDDTHPTTTEKHT